MEFGAPPGTVASLDLESLPAIKIDDFSMHQAPASNLLRELRDHCGVQVVLVACQPAEIPQEVRPGLSATVREAVPRAIRVVREWCAPEEDPS
jgi:hydrogenase maturation protease